jgi:hypothetical protein
MATSRGDARVLSDAIGAFVGGAVRACSTPARCSACVPDLSAAPASAEANVMLPLRKGAVGLPSSGDGQSQELAPVSAFW